MITHWDEVDWTRRERGHIAGAWQALTGEASRWVGVQRIRVDPGAWSTPLHLEASEEEIFFVLEGDGVSVQWDGTEEQAYAIGAGDCLVHLALEHAHTIKAGPNGIDVLAFGERHYAANTLLPRAGVSWLGPTWVLQGAPDDHPWAREAAVGPPEDAPLVARPRRIVNVEDVSASERRGATVSRRSRDLATRAGSLKTGLKLYDVDGGKLMSAPHVHSAEEEIYVVLDGEGTLLRWPHARAATEPGVFPGDGIEEHPVRRGSVIAQPAGTGRPLGLRAGEAGLRVLAYGTREPNDICFYPRSGKISFRGVGVIGRIEPLGYWDGED
ncbi:MAG: hypothetical protein ACRC50_12925 [Gaiella sp.]